MINGKLNPLTIIWMVNHISKCIKISQKIILLVVECMTKYKLITEYMCDFRETTVESLRNQLIGGVSMNLNTISLIIHAENHINPWNFINRLARLVPPFWKKIQQTWGQREMKQRKKQRKKQCSGAVLSPARFYMSLK